MTIGALSILPIPMVQFTMKPLDDTAFVQWHLDNNKELPDGNYRVGVLSVGRGRALKMSNNVMVFGNPYLRFK